MGEVIKLADRINAEVLATNASRRIKNVMSSDSIEAMHAEAIKRLRAGQDIDMVIDELGITEGELWDAEGMPSEFMDQCETAMFMSSLDTLVDIGVDGVMMLLRKPWASSDALESALRIHLANLVKSTAETVEMYDLPEDDLPESFDAAMLSGEHGDEPPAA